MKDKISSAVRYSVFLVPKKNCPSSLDVGFHVGWQSESCRVSKFGPFKTEEQAYRCLARIRGDLK